MKASYGWLKAMLPGLQATPKQLAERFVHAGVEVEGIEEYGVSGEAIVVATVRKVEPHPTRPKLQLVTVDRGGAEQRVVCGAPNVPPPGGLVVLAPLGTELAAIGMTVNAREIGGIVSEGMLCSEMELGLIPPAKGDADPGILVMDESAAKAGQPLRNVVPNCHDWILDLSLTPNRPDGLGHVGLAREAAALFDLDFEMPSPDAPQRIASGTTINKVTSVSIEDADRCPHYGAALVVDVAIGPSPAWVRYRLESLGIRAISNVVDVTNLILLEFGHPMHAFDLDLLRGEKIVVRRPRANETLATLDGVERKLDPDDLVIADAEGPVALAGVMGGAGSEIRASTRRVLLECAYFTSRGIRRASRRHALHTESSHRFERGVDPSDIPDALAQAATLITSFAHGSAVPGTILAGVPVADPVCITLRSQKIDGLVGTKVPFEEASSILTRLGCTVRAVVTDSSSGQTSAQVLAPLHRPDIKLEEDLIDEIVRVRGFDKIPTVLPAIRPQPPRSTGVLEARVRQEAIGLGLSEAITFAFVSPKDIAALGLQPAEIVLKNPLSEERSVMRTSLLPGLLDVLRRARRHGESDVRLFTVGSRILSSVSNHLLPDELPSFAALLAGQTQQPLSAAAPIDVYDAKGLVVEIVERVTGRMASVGHQPESQRAPYLHPCAAGQVMVDTTVVGCFGPLHPNVIEALDLGGSAVVVELDLVVLEKIGKIIPQYRPIPVLPAIARDIALIVHDDITAGAVGEAIAKAAGELCESVTLFDLFRGGNIPPEHRSLAFRTVYRDPRASTDPEQARTLTDQEVDEQHRRVTESVERQFGAVVRV